MSRPDPIEILVRNQMEALVAHGVPLEEAAVEAEARVAKVMEEMNHLGLADVYVGVALRRARVFRMKSQGKSVAAICEVVGVGSFAVKKDYREELLRRRIHG